MDNMPPMKRIPDEVAEPWNGPEPPFFKGMGLAARKLRFRALSLYTVIAMLSIGSGLMLGIFTPPLVWIMLLVSASCMLAYFASRWIYFIQAYDKHQQEHQKPLVVIRDRDGKDDKAA